MAQESRRCLGGVAVEVKIRQRIVAAEQITAVLGALQRLPQVRWVGLS